jgi:L-ascorbate metabolism protein UlaG (beta-lactamase superfamily)
MQSPTRLLRAVCAIALLDSLTIPGRAQSAPRFVTATRGTNQEIRLQVAVDSGKHFRLESTDSLPSWQALATIKSTGTNAFTDYGSVYSGARFYRAVELADAPLLTGDHVATSDGDLVIHPVNHASFVMQWKDTWIYNDPVGGASPYATWPRASLILVSHSHSDHFDSATLTALRSTNTILIAPAPVYVSLSAALKAQTISLANGMSTNVAGIQVEAIPAYNANHTKGTGNGYVLTLGGRRIFMTGDTGNIPEMRALTDIDVAFVCMNIPFTMSIAEAVTAVRAFKPRVVYPYHYRNQDNSLSNLETFRQQLGFDLPIEVRARKWY